MRCLGYYVTCDDALCLDCFRAKYGDDALGAEDSPGFTAWRKAGGFEGWDEPIAIMSDSESDTPTHCDKCKELIPHALTSDGYEYVEEAAREHLTEAADPLRETPNAHSVKVVHAWLEEYGDYDINGIVARLHAALYEAMDEGGYFDDDEPYDHSRAKEDARNAYLEQ